MTALAESPQPWPTGPVPTSGAARSTFAVSALTPFTTVQRWLLLVGMVLFDWLFWREKDGVNILVFTVFVVGAQLLMLPRHAAALRSAYFWLMVGGSLFGGAMMAVYGSTMAALACMASVALLLGYVNQPSLKLVLYALLTAAGSVAQAGARLLGGLRATRMQACAGAGSTADCCWCPWGFWRCFTCCLQWPIRCMTG